MSESHRDTTSLAAATVAAVGFTSLAYELVQVRMLAFFLGNNLDFLAIPLALLGLAIGSAYAHFAHRGPLETIVRRGRLVTLPLLAAVLVVFFLVANTFFSRIHVGLADPATDSWRLLAYGAIFLPPYVVFGAMLSALFGQHPDRVGRLYFFDLTGAAAACVLTPTVLTAIDLWAALLGVLAVGLALFALEARRDLRLAAGVVGFGVLAVLAGTGVVFREHPNPVALAKSVLAGVDKPRVQEVAVRWSEIARTALLHITSQTDADIDLYYLVMDNGLSNARGTVAMARTAMPDSATSQFFINVVDNPNLDSYGGGYAVFGKVTQGMDVVDKIRAVQTANKGPHQNVPLEPVLIKKASLE